MYCKFDHILMGVKSGVQLLCVLKQQLETRRSFLPGSCIKEQPFQSIYRRIGKQFSVVICDACGTMIGFKAVVISPNHSHFLFKYHTWLSTIRVKCIFECGEGPFKPTAL